MTEMERRDICSSFTLCYKPTTHIIVGYTRSMQRSINDSILHHANTHRCEHYLHSCHTACILPFRFISLKVTITPVLLSQIPRQRVQQVKLFTIDLARLLRLLGVERTPLFGLSTCH